MVTHIKMELKGVCFDGENFFIPKPKVKLFSFKERFKFQIPEIVLTEEEAKARGLNLLDKKGYFTKIGRTRVLITII